MRRRWLVALSACLAGCLALGLTGWWFVGRTLGSVGRDRAVVAELAPRPRAGEPVTVLVVGSDRRAGLEAGDDRFGPPGAVTGERADAVVLLRLPGHPGDRVRALSLPRDLLVDVDGFGPQKLAAALGLGGSRLLVRAVVQATGVTVHHYLEVDFAGFASAVDRLGGVTVELDAPARDPYSGFEAGSGLQRLDGEAALAYVRSRNYEELRQGEWVAAGGGDLARIERQHRLLHAAATEAAGASPVQAVRWLGEVGPHLTVDARLGSRGLHRLARRLARADALDLTTLPVRLLHEEATTASPFAPAHPGTIHYLVAADSEARDLLGSWLLGSWLLESRRGEPIR